MKRHIHVASILVTFLCLVFTVSQTQAQRAKQLSGTKGNVSIRGDVWADNWFALYLGEQLLIEDSVSITTERSFNAESFTFNADYPLMLNFVVKDFKENDSGLEYIGSRKQQMGDGGFIAQFEDTTTNQTIAISGDHWKCLVIHNAPLDKACAKSRNPVAGKGACQFTALDEPAGWKSLDFDDSQWASATEYSSWTVRPKGGYDRISWDRNAELIWTGDLETHNTILCRLKVNVP